MAAPFQEKNRSASWLIGSLAVVLLALLVTKVPVTSYWSLNVRTLHMVKEHPSAGSIFGLVSCQAADSRTGSQMGEFVDHATKQRETVYQGYRDWQAGHCGKAIESWQAAVELDPKDRWTEYRLGLAYCYLEMPLPAERTFRRFKDLAQIREHVTAYGRDAITQKDRVSWQEVAFCVFPSRVAFRRLQENLPSVGREDEIAGFLVQLIERTSQDSFDYWWARGLAAENENDWRRAKDLYLTAMIYTREAKELDVLYSSAARMYQRLGDPVCATYLKQMIGSGDPPDGVWHPDCLIP